VQKEKSHTKVKKQENTKGKVVLKKSRTKTIIIKRGQNLEVLASFHVPLLSCIIAYLN
jgi:hypothetical protein